MRRPTADCFSKTPHGGTSQKLKIVQRRDVSPAVGDPNGKEVNGCSLHLRDSPPSPPFPEPTSLGEPLVCRCQDLGLLAGMALADVGVIETVGLAARTRSLGPVPASCLLSRSAGGQLESRACRAVSRLHRTRWVPVTSTQVRGSDSAVTVNEAFPRAAGEGVRTDRGAPRPGQSQTTASCGAQRGRRGSHRLRRGACVVLKESGKTLINCVTT